MLDSKKIFFIDCDGTLALGDKPLEGAADFINELKKRKKIIYILTNNSSKIPGQHLAKFKHLQLDLDENNILVSTQAALEYFKELKIKEIFWLANEKVAEYITKLGFNFNEKTPQAVLLTYDNTITYAKLEKFIHHLRNNIPYYATHEDIVCPDPNGYLPDIGTFIKLIEMTTGILPKKIFGKPNKDFIEPIIKKHNLTHNDAVIIGDRLYTDMKLAENSQITSVLVLTGETKQEDYKKSSIRCDIVVANLAELMRYF